MFPIPSQRGLAATLLSLKKCIHRCTKSGAIGQNGNEKNPAYAEHIELDQAFLKYSSHGNH